MALLKLRLSENFQFYTMLHYWHLLYRGKKNWQVGVCHVKYLQKSMESCFILLFSHDHEVLYELTRKRTNKICEDISSSLVPSPHPTFHCTESDGKLCGAWERG